MWTKDSKPGAQIPSSDDVLLVSSCLPCPEPSEVGWRQGEFGSRAAVQAPGTHSQPLSLALLQSAKSGELRIATSSWTF